MSNIGRPKRSNEVNASREFISMNILSSLDNLRILARQEDMPAIADIIDAAYVGCTSAQLRDPSRK